MAKSETITQAEKFKKAAKAVGTSSDEAAFNAALKRIGKATVPAKIKKKAIGKGGANG